VSTINRTFKAFAFAIVGAEYVLRWLPRGTHQWHKFLRPSEIERHTRLNGLRHRESSGMVLNPLKNEWRIDPKDIDVNYLMVFGK
jgi:2-polyprenyl-6-hydroxyphenyl methylase/3-demethylubiquinone-9 3-methyltransferase